MNYWSNVAFGIKLLIFFQEITDNELSAICDESVPKIVSVFQLNRIVRKEAEAETSSVERFGLLFTFFGCVSTTKENFHFSRMYSYFLVDTVRLFKTTFLFQFRDKLPVQMPGLSERFFGFDRVEQTPAQTRKRSGLEASL
jgi:hypothetical protein